MYMFCNEYNLKPTSCSHCGTYINVYVQTRIPAVTYRVNKNYDGIITNIMYCILICQMFSILCVI